jgi:hypothetical protein
MADKKKTSADAAQAPKLITERIKELADWRGERLARIRALIKEADPEVVEEWKWGIPVWSHSGLICTGESYKDHLKLTFAKGATLKDPDHLFTQPGTVRRAIDIFERDKIREAPLKNLVRAAVELNLKKK